MSHYLFVGAILGLAGLASFAGFAAAPEAPACGAEICAPHDVQVQQISD